MYVPCLNLKTCSFTYRGGSHTLVGILVLYLHITAVTILKPIYMASLFGLKKNLIMLLVHEVVNVFQMK